MHSKLYLQEWAIIFSSLLRYFFPEKIDAFSYFLILFAMWIIKHSHEGYHLGNL